MTNVQVELDRLFPAHRSPERENAWEANKKRLSFGAVVRGVVLAQLPFGVLVDIDAGFPGIILVTRLKDADKQPYTSLKMFPAIGSTVDARVCAWVDSTRQIALTQLDVPLEMLARF